MKTSPLTTNWQRLPEKAIRALQADKLRRYLRDTVLPFSAYYGELFQQHGLSADSIRTLEDLQNVPFTSKADLLNTPDHPQRMRDCLLIPEKRQLARRPTTILRGRRRDPMRAGMMATASVNA